MRKRRSSFADADHNNIDGNKIRWQRMNSLVAALLLVGAFCSHPGVISVAVVVAAVGATETVEAALATATDAVASDVHQQSQLNATPGRNQNKFLMRDKVDFILHSPRDDQQQQQQQQTNRASGGTPAGSLQGIWAREVAKAQHEVERILQGMMMSITMPTTAPPPNTVAPSMVGSTIVSTAPSIANSGTSRPSGLSPSPSSATQTPSIPPAITTPPVASQGPVLGTSRPSTGGGPGQTLIPSMVFFGSDIPTMFGVSDIPTSIAACLIGTTLEDYLLEMLVPITNATVLLDMTTPQGMAFNFLLTDPLLQNPCDYPTIVQRYSLATYYFSTSGASWVMNTGWLSATDECEWFGVVCFDGVHANNLTMAVNNVKGTLPNEISALTTLDRIELFGNLLSSTIPTGISNLTDLNVIDLEQNKLTGSILPDDILSLPMLTQVFFSNNAFTGTLPTDMGRISTVQDFWMAGNNVMGTIPESFGNLTNLHTVIMYDNQLEGSLPQSIGNLTDLSNLQLYGNVLSGSIPDALYGLTALSVLLMENNVLSGTLSTRIGELTGLLDCRFEKNFLEGTLPTEIGQLTNLRYIVGGTNFFSGTIPNVFAAMTALQVVDLPQCFFKGTIPDSLFSVPTMKRIYLNNNVLTGSIPTTYSNLPSLEDMFLNNNFITGTVPDINPASQLQNLNELLLQFNLLNGTVPAGICALRTDAVLDNLFADCGGATPEIACAFPDCCNRCFEGTDTGTDDGLVTKDDDLPPATDDKAGSSNNVTSIFSGSQRRQRILDEEWELLPMDHPLRELQRQRNRESRSDGGA